MRKQQWALYSTLTFYIYVLYITYLKKLDWKGEISDIGSWNKSVSEVIFLEGETYFITLLAILKF